MAGSRFDAISDGTWLDATFAGAWFDVTLADPRFDAAQAGPSFVRSAWTVLLAILRSRHQDVDVPSAGWLDDGSRCRHSAMPGGIRKERQAIGQPLCPSFGIAMVRISRLKPSRLRSRQRTVNGLGRDWRALPKGLAMSIRSTRFGIRGGEANVARTPAIPAASLPTLRIGGLLLLSCP